jgi:hypothetical protein
VPALSQSACGKRSEHQYGLALGQLQSSNTFHAYIITIIIIASRECYIRTSGFKRFERRTERKQHTHTHAPTATTIRGHKLALPDTQHRTKAAAKGPQQPPLYLRAVHGVVSVCIASASIPIPLQRQTAVLPLQEYQPTKRSAVGHLAQVLAYELSLPSPHLPHSALPSADTGKDLPIPSDSS